MTTLPPQGPPVGREHPRLRRRRAEVRRQAGRRRLRLLLAGLVCVAVAAGAWAALRSPLLDVDRIVVDGAVQSGTEAVVASSGVRGGTGMAAVNEHESARRVETLPWVRQAVVRRQWPGTVRISVVERSPVAVTRAVSAQWAVVDDTGRVLAWSSDRPPLPLLVDVVPAGPPGSSLDRTTSAGLLSVAQSVPAGLASRLGGIKPRGPEVDLELVPRGLVRLGPPLAVAEKLSTVEAILARVDPRTIASIDVRFPSTAVLTRG